MSDRIATGITGLDEILRGGLPPNRLYLVNGNPGSGKTTLALQFLIEGARRKEPVLYVTLSETRTELMDVARSHQFVMDDINISDLASVLGETTDSSYTLFHPSEIELGETTSAILKDIERIQPTRIVFDSLSELRLLARDPLRYRRQILFLKQYFAGRKSTVLLLDDSTSADSDRQLESVAHGVLVLDQQYPRYGGPRRHIRIVKLRGVNFAGGYHDLDIETGGVVVYPRLVAADHSIGFKPEVLSSGIPELDSLTGGGLEAGTAVLLLGPAGTGKSTIASQYAGLAASRGVHAAYFTLDESRATLLKRSSTIGIGLEPAIEKGHCTVRQIDPAEMSAGEFSALVRRSVEQDHAKIVIIDSINGYQQSMPDEDFLALHLHELLGYLRLQGVLTIMVMAQTGMMGAAMLSPVDISYLADTVILLRFFENGGQIRKAVSVVKKRTGDHEDTIREFAITRNGIRVGDTLREFRGVLTGVPVYTGSQGEMMRKTE